MLQASVTDAAVAALDIHPLLFLKMAQSKSLQSISYSMSGLYAHLDILYAQLLRTGEHCEDH